MSKSAIEEKLTRQLNSVEPFTEARVVYILVETRKLMERRKELKKADCRKQTERENYESKKAARLNAELSFYCDWALHVEMNKDGAQRILKMFDEAHPLLCRDKSVPPSLDKNY